MALQALTMRGAATTLAYLVVGALGTAAAGLGVLYALRGLQPLLYHVAYPALGPSTATEFAILLHVVVAGAIGIAAVAIGVEYASHRGQNARAFAHAIGVIAGLVLALAAATLAGLDPFGGAVAWVVAVALAVPLLLWVREGVGSGGAVAYVGGVPVLVLLLLLAGVGVGWGWGFVMTAHEIPAGEVGGDVAAFESAPEVRDDLLADRNCEVGADGHRQCLLQLRGYIREREAAQFLDRHGVRCPFRGSAEDAGSFVAEHGETYYRVSCASHGD